MLELDIEFNITEDLRALFIAKPLAGNNLLSFAINQ